ncbi:phosphoribosyl-ATP diphosphatase [Acidocella aromatica]|uniref:Phosphoribosyl-ATP pyrophosphatase n=1 Tax=Acidocella aromatica TaxID=1303579 RepID=A0A840VS06_9PROT|nr:phosphoribosyl-ATP diphosphatase [Acidocella aromatica]MBB5374381.1 phosphoribosyl-ATP pyrophosphohydrolase [Acidocella aromatica]
MAKKAEKTPETAPKKKAAAAKPKTTKTKAAKPAPARRQVTVPPPFAAPDARVLDRLWATVLSRKDADPNQSHSARLLSRGTEKVAQKFGEEAVECVIEAVAGKTTALIGESADVLYHLLVLWVDAGLRPEQVWAELTRREGMSGIAEKAARKPLQLGFPTKKIP